MRKYLFILMTSLLLLSGCQKKALESDVYYQIFLRSFADSDGDGIGDFKGVEKKLDYLVDLGVEGIWLTPIHPSPSYHGYDVIDYKDVHSDFGTKEDFQSLLDKVHAKDMKLIIDLVVNHTSSEHPWFKKAKEEVEKGSCDRNDTYCHYYHFSEKPLPNYEKDGTEMWYEAVFWSKMPDLNLDHEDVRKAIIDTAKFWLDMGVDGFRLDATSHFYEGKTQDNTEFLDWFQKELRRIKEDVYLVGEAWEPSQIRLEMYQSGLDSFFNFDISGQDSKLIEAIRKQQGESFGRQMHAYHQAIYEMNPHAIDAPFLSNHDQGRSASYFMGDERHKRFAANVYLLMPGRPYIYYGEEIAMTGSGKDENKRLAMPWGDRYETSDPLDADYVMKDVQSVKAARKNANSLWHHYQKLLKIRSEYTFLYQKMNYTLKTWDASVYAYEIDGYVMLHSFHHEAQTLKMDGIYEIVEIISGDAKSQEDQLFLEPYTSIILKSKH